MPAELSEWTTTEAEPINGGQLHRPFRQPVPVEDCQICAKPYLIKEHRKPGPKPKASINTVRTIGSLPSGWSPRSTTCPNSFSLLSNSFLMALLPSRWWVLLVQKLQVVPRPTNSYVSIFKSYSQSSSCYWQVVTKTLKKDWV